MDLRAIAWAVAAVLLAFVLFELYRAYRTGRKAASGQEGEAPAVPAPATSAFPPTSPPRSEQFQTELEIRQLRRDLERMQEEIGEHRRELADTAAALRAVKEQLESKLVSQGVSPEYNEALVFARRGLGVEAIAERCGISVAEAELVRALAQRGESREDRGEP